MRLDIFDVLITKEQKQYIIYGSDHVKKIHMVYPFECFNTLGIDNKDIIDIPFSEVHSIRPMTKVDKDEIDYLVSEKNSTSTDFGSIGYNIGNFSNYTNIMDMSKTLTMEFSIPIDEIILPNFENGITYKKLIKRITETGDFSALLNKITHLDESTLENKAYIFSDVRFFIIKEDNLLVILIPNHQCVYIFEKDIVTHPWKDGTSYGGFVSLVNGIKHVSINLIKIENGKIYIKHQPTVTSHVTLIFKNKDNNKWETVEYDSNRVF